MKIKIEQLEHCAGIPEYKSQLAAGADCYASCNDFTIRPHERKLVPLGFKLELPEGFEAQLRPRSGLALKQGLTLVNAPGTIDADYRGEVCAAILNTSTENQIIHRGDRICQMVINKIEIPKIEVVKAVNKTERGEGGFGSTGTK